MNRFSASTCSRHRGDGRGPPQRDAAGGQLGARLLGVHPAALPAHELLGEPARGTLRVEVGQRAAAAGQGVELATLHGRGDLLLDEQVEEAHRTDVTDGDATPGRRAGDGNRTRVDQLGRLRFYL